MLSPKRCLNSLAKRNLAQGIERKMEIEVAKSQKSTSLWRWYSYTGSYEIVS
jgi:hypothetical protein